MTGLRTATLLFLLAILLSIGVYYLAPHARAEVSQESITYGINGTAIINATSGSITLENGTVIPLGEKNLLTLLQNITASPPTAGGTYLVYNSANYARRVPVAITNLSRYQKFNPNNTVRINQGDCVFLGETIDISGQNWYTGQLNYYGIFMDDYSAEPGDNLIQTRQYSSRDSFAFYIDPVYFAKYPGWWYYNNHARQYDKYLESWQAPPSNDRAFFVGGESCPELNQSKDLVKLALNQSLIENAIQRNLTELLIKKDELGADLIISKNLTTRIDATPSHQWLIGAGSTPAMYDVPITQNTITFTPNQTRNLKPGIYHNILIPADKNGVFDVRYDPGLKAITSPFRDVENISVDGLQPSMIETILLKQVNTSYAPKYILQTIDFQEPAITLNKFDQWQNLKGETIFSLAGYTNANPGDTVTIRLDANRTYPKSDGSRTWITQVPPHGNMGDYREWTDSIKMNFDKLTPGPHWLSIDTYNGAHMDATFFVRKEPAANYQPEVFLKYIGSSPFVPPVYINTTVTVQVPGPTQYVYVDVTPRPEVVQAAADKSTWAAVAQIATWIAEAVVGVLLGFLIVWAYSSYRRAKK